MSFHEDSFHQSKNKKFKMDSNEMEQLAEVLGNGFNSGNISTLFDEDDSIIIEKFLRWYDIDINVRPTYWNDDGTIYEIDTS